MSARPWLPEGHLCLFATYLVEAVSLGMRLKVLMLVRNLYGLRTMEIHRLGVKLWSVHELRFFEFLDPEKHKSHPTIPIFHSIYFFLLYLPRRLPRHLAQLAAHTIILVTPFQQRRNDHLQGMTSYTVPSIHPLYQNFREEHC